MCVFFVELVVGSEHTWGLCNLQIASRTVLVKENVYLDRSCVYSET